MPGSIVKVSLEDSKNDMSNEDQINGFPLLFYMYCKLE